jgi:hypothetical protein
MWRWAITPAAAIDAIAEAASPIARLKQQAGTEAGMARAAHIGSAVI